MTTPRPEALTAAEEAELRAGMDRIFREYVPTGEDKTIRRLLATLDAARTPAPDLRAALVEELYGLGVDGEVMVRIEEAVAAVNSRWSIEARAALGGATPEPTPDAGVWDTDLTNGEIVRLADALAEADYMNWSSLGLAAMIQGTVRAIAAARLSAPTEDKP